MYEQFYHLRADPFALSPNPGFAYPHASYKKAKTYMRFALTRGEGILLITGKPGTGKTTLVKELLGDLEMTKYKVATLVSTQLEADDLLRSVAYSFGLNVGGASKATVIQQLSHYLQRRRQNRLYTILIVDEAQDLSEKALEELRLLTNFDQDNKPLLQVFLVGQPQLLDLLGSSGLEQVRQRITVATSMRPLLEQEVKEYIQHRLTLVGWKRDPDISQDMYSFIHQYTDGIPRKINQLCTRLLLHGFVEDKHLLDIDALRAVIAELDDEHLSMSHKIPPSRPLPMDELIEKSVYSDIRKLH